MRTLGLAVVLVAGGCAAGAEPPASTPPEPAATRPAPKLASAPPEASLSSRRPRPTFPELAELAGRPVLLRAHGDDAVLFGDEMARLGDAARRALGELGLRPLPASEVTKLEAVAASGRLVEAGPVCAVAPTAEDVLNAAHPDLTHADLYLGCRWSKCSLDLTVSSTRPAKYDSDSSPPVARVSAEVATPLDVGAWEKALALTPAKAVEPPRPSSGGVGIGIGGLGGFGPSWSIRDRIEIGPFAPSASNKDLDAEVRALSACPYVPRWEMPSVLLAVSAGGAVQRCEGQPTGAFEGCACRVFSAHGFEPASAARRVRVELAPSAPPSGIGGGFSGLGRAGGSRRLAGPHPARPWVLVELATSFDESHLISRPRGEALTACFAPAPALQPGAGNPSREPGPDHRFGLGLVLDARGVVERATLEHDDWMTDKERACVVKAARAFTFRCPQTPSSATRAVGLVYGR